MKRFWWVWKCNYCGRRNKSAMRTMTFEFGRRYTAEWECCKCKRINLLYWDLTSDRLWEPPFKRRK